VHSKLSSAYDRRGLVLTGQRRLGLDDICESLKLAEPGAMFATSTVMADNRITVECDEREFFPDFFTMFGGPAPVPGRLSIPSDIHLEIHARARQDFGWFRMTGSNDLPIDGHELSFAIELESGQFELFDLGEDGWKCIGFRGSNVPAFAFRGRDCLFSLDPRWRLCIIWYLFWRLLRIRSDAIFFHASAVNMFGEGTIFVGPAGGGKSTTSMALAARGHNFLSDEIAGYLPATGELIPFRRPVGIKRGPRSSAVQRGLTPGAAAQIDRDGFLRVDIDTLFAVEPPKAIPLRRMVFLRGFADRPAMTRIKPGRGEIAELQPLMSSFLNASHSRRIFELTRLLGSAKVYQLHPGEPDTTAAYIEEFFACEKSHPS
jgi:hypothetical protein